MRSSENFQSSDFVVGDDYKKSEVARLGHLTPPKNNREWSGLITCTNSLLLFVTLDKTGRQSHLQYTDYFDDGGRLFFWDSQNRATNDAQHIQNIVHGSVDIHLFCRIEDRQPFTYIGKLGYGDHEGEKPVHFLYSVSDYDDSIESLGNLYNWQRGGRRELTPIEKPERRQQKPSGQGYVADAKKRRAIELHAMIIARSYYESSGWDVVDTSANNPYDYQCHRSDEVLRVEVKGTSMDLSTIIVTSGEVENAWAKEYPVDLFVVSNILISKEGENYSTTNGDVYRLQNWNPEEKDLTPTQYRYKVPLLQCLPVDSKESESNE